LRQLLKSLIKNHPDSFLSPLTWAKHRELIQSVFSKDADCPRTVFDNINRRNRRLSLPGKDKEFTAQQRLIQLLDTTFSGLPADDLPKKCWKIDEDKHMLVKAVIAWSTSSHRPGHAKIYIGARICRFWSKNRFDITSTILDFADSQQCGSGRNKPAFYHLLSELARSGHFSIAKYIQWLIARGGLHDASDVSPDGPCATRLLAELPTHNLSDSMSSLHSTLLDRVEFSVDEEEENMRKCMSFINNDLPALRTPTDSDMELDHVAVMEDPAISISQLSRSSKSEIGLWLRHKVTVHMQQAAKPQAEAWEGGPIKKTAQPTVTPAHFDKVRHYLELTEDYSMLADVLKITVSSNDVDVLASCADTINLHIDALAAIGAVNSLFEILSTRLRILANGQDSLPRTFLASLANLASRIPSQRVSAHQWSQELALFDRRTAANACSPVSDHIAITQTAEVDFFDEMEKILASGNSMDQPTLSRLFGRISHHLELSWDKTSQEQKTCGLLLSRLRPFDVEHFDVLISVWLERFLTLPGRPSMMAALGPLVSFGCLSLTSISASCNNVGIPARGLASSTVSQELVQLLFGVPSSTIQAMGIEDSYRLRVSQANTYKDSPGEVLSSIRRGVEQARSQKATPGSPIILDVLAMLRDPKPFEVLQRFALLQAELVIQTLALPLLKIESSAGTQSITSIVNELLFGRNSEDMDSTEAILKIANDLTLPFCQIKLELMFSGEDSTMAGADESKPSRLQAFDGAIEAAVNSGRTAWASIVPLLEMSVAQHLRRRSELQFLALILSPKTVSNYEPSASNARLEHANNLLRIVDSTAYSVADIETKTSNSASIAQDMLVVLNGLRILLSTTQNLQIKNDIIREWLPLLLRFITHHTSEFEATKLGNESRAKVILALSAILLELQASDINTPSANGIVEQIYDLALYLVDALPEDVRQQCVRSLHDTMHNAQMYYLFSFQRNPFEGLVLSQKETHPPVVVSGSGENSTTDQRQFLGNKEKIMPFNLRRWEMIGEPTPNVGENDTSLNLTLFGARRG
jgi:mediator of RNA polymerase II transcription subunit 12